MNLIWGFFRLVLMTLALQPCIGVWCYRLWSGFEVFVFTLFFLFLLVEISHKLATWMETEKAYW